MNNSGNNNSNSNHIKLNNILIHELARGGNALSIENILRSAINRVVLHFIILYRIVGIVFYSIVGYCLVLYSVVSRCHVLHCIMPDLAG